MHFRSPKLSAGTPGAVLGKWAGRGLSLAALLSRERCVALRPCSSSIQHGHAGQEMSVQRRTAYNVPIKNDLLQSG